MSPSSPRLIYFAPQSSVMPVEIEPESFFKITHDNLFSIMYAAHIGQLLCLASLCLLIWDICECFVFFVPWHELSLTK